MTIKTLKILAKKVMNLLELRKKTKDVSDLNKELEKYTSLFNKREFKYSVVYNSSYLFKVLLVCICLLTSLSL